MKFLCLECDAVMAFAERQLPGDGTLAAVFSCEACGREMAMLTNPMETQVVSSMGVRIGGREVPEQPMEIARTSLADGREEAFQEIEDPAEKPEAGSPDVPDGDSTDEQPGTTRPAGPVSVTWTPEALERLERVPRFVRGMVKRIYSDYARERGITDMTPESMDRARSDLGLEGM